MNCNAQRRESEAMFTKIAKLIFVIVWMRPVSFVVQRKPQDKFNLLSSASAARRLAKAWR